MDHDEYYDEYEEHCYEEEYWRSRFVERDAMDLIDAAYASVWERERLVQVTTAQWEEIQKLLGKPLHTRPGKAPNTIVATYDDGDSDGYADSIYGTWDFVVPSYRGAHQ